MKSLELPEAAGAPVAADVAEGADAMVNDVKSYRILHTFWLHGQILYLQGLVDKDVVDDCSIYVMFSLDVPPHDSVTKGVETYVRKTVELAQLALPAARSFI